MGDARAGIVPLDMSNSMAPTFLHVTSTVQVLNSCLLVFFLVLFGICVSLRAGRFLSARSGRLPSSSCSTSSLQQPAIRQPGYGSFVRPVFHKLCLWSAAIRGTSEHGDGGGFYMGARTVALCLLPGSGAALFDLIPPQLFHGCERRSPAIPPHFLHGCGIVFLVLFGICVSLRAGRFLSARSGRLPSSSCSTSSLLLGSGVAQLRAGIMVRHTGRRIRFADLVLATKVIPVRLMTKTHHRWVARPLTSPTKNYKKDKTTLNTAAFTRRRLPPLWWRLR